MKLGVLGTSRVFIGRILESDFMTPCGFRQSWHGWREHATLLGKACSKVDPDLAPLQAYLGVMGAPGLIAYGVAGDRPIQGW